MPIDYKQIGEVNRQPDNLNLQYDTKFKFSIRKLPFTDFFCVKANIPEIRLQHPTFKTPLNDVPIVGINLQWSLLEIEFLINEGMRNYRELFNWINGLGSPKSFGQFAKIRKENTDLNSKFGGLYSDAILHVLSNESNPAVNILYRNLFPVSISAIGFDSRKLDSEPLVAKVEFAYSYYEFEEPGNNPPA
jgi:hypothetical protein